MRGGALRGIALLFSVISGLALIVHQQVSSDGIPLGVFTETVEAALNGRVGNAEVSIGDARLTRSRTEPSLFALTARDVAFRGEDGAVRLPDLSFGLMGRDILTGQRLPRSIAIEGATLFLVRDEDGFSFTSGAAGPFDLAAFLDRADTSEFEGARLDDVSLRYRDQTTGAGFVLRHATMRLEPSAEGFAGVIEAPVGSGRLRVETRIDTQAQRAEAAFDIDSVPSEALLPLVLGPDAGAGLSIAFSGEAKASLDLAGTAAELAFDLTGEDGILTFGKERRRISRTRLDGRYEAGARRLRIDSFLLEGEGLQGRLSGDAVLSPQGPRLTLSAEALTLAVPGLPAPLEMDTLALQAGLKSAERTLELTDLRAAFPSGAGLEGRMDLLLPAGGEEGLGIEGALSGSGAFPRPLVLALWPEALAPGARRWIVSHLSDASLSEFSARIAVPRGGLAKGRRIDKDMVDLAFAFSGADIEILDGLPPVRNGRGRAAVTGDGFTLTADGGALGGATLEALDFVLPSFAPDGPPATIRAALTGEVPALLTLADAPRFGYLAQAGFAPGDFSGEGRFAFTLTRPLRALGGGEELEFSGEGRFEELSIEGLPAGIELSGGRGELTVTPQRLVVNAALDAQGVPATAHLEQRFEPDRAIFLKAEAMLDAGSADAFGLPLRRRLRGEVPATFTLEGQERPELATLSLDLSGAELRMPEIGIAKAAGAGGSARVALRLHPGQPLSVETLKLVTDDVLVEGSAQLDAAGGLVEIDMPRVFVAGLADLSAKLSRGRGELALRLDGRYLDARRLIDLMLRGGGASAGDAAIPPLRIEAALAEAQLKGGVTLRGFSARAQHDGMLLHRLEAGGAYASGGRVDLRVAPSETGIGREVLLSTGSFGSMVRGLFGITSVTGDAAQLAATAIEDGPVAGTFSAENILLRDAPLVARLLSIGSLDGLASMLNGEGLQFDRLEGDLQLHSGVLRLQDARMTGSALGLSAGGEVDLGGRNFDLSGAVAPAYGVNSFLGAIPGLGDLLVNREGEGVVAFAYGVEGPIAEPTVTVNTLSALAPGIFRRLFEPIREDRPSTEDLLDAAQAAARAEAVPSADPSQPSPSSAPEAAVRRDAATAE